MIRVEALFFGKLRFLGSMDRPDRRTNPLASARENRFRDLQHFQSCVSARAESWKSIREGPPEARAGHATVWTGIEMIIWGGQGTGGHYNPSSDTWTSTSVAGLPKARIDHTAVWTGTEIIVCGMLDALQWAGTRLAC